MKKFISSLFGALFILGIVLIMSCNQKESPIALEYDPSEVTKPLPNNSISGINSNASVLFEDDFNDGNYDDWTVETGSWSIENGELYGIGAGGNVDAWIYTGNSSWTDYILEAKVIFKTGNAELVFRSTGHWQNEYRLSLWSEGSPAYTNMFKLFRYKNGVVTLFADSISPVPITNPASAKVEILGSTIRLFLNGQLIYEIEDPDPLTNGEVGLGVIWDWYCNFDDVVVTSISTTMAVDIDIKPGSYPNSINCRNDNGIIPVAILTTSDFDVTTVDHTTVHFGREGTEATETHKNEKTGELKRHEEDVDGDGDIDLIFHFRFVDTGIECGDTEAILTGETYSGQKIKGIDNIRTVALEALEE